MATTDAPDSAGTNATPTQTSLWRLRYMVGDLEHYTEWTADFPTIENYYDQYRHGDHAHDVAIERRAVIET